MLMQKSSILSRSPRWGVILWFEPVTIPLGTGLVSIIGKRGSGKSALAELITFAAGSWVKENRSTFIERAYKHIAGLEVELIWRNGDHLPAVIGQAAQSKPRLRYLSEHFVEKLCSVDHTGVELVHEIERVIFAHTPVEDRLGAASLTNCARNGAKPSARAVQAKI